MELTLKRLLEHAEFKKYRGKGYDPAEVDEFLDKAAAMAGKVEVQLTSAMEQARAAGGPSASPADIEAEVERRTAERVAQRIAELPVAPAGQSEEEVAEEARRTLTLAQRTADAAVREAREDAEQIIATANEQAATLIADATAAAESAKVETEAYVSSNRADVEAYVASTRADVEAEAVRERREARQRLATEIGELEGTRETLRADVNILERHVEEQRSQLGSTLAELQQILDDPSGFRMAPVPALAEPELPDFTDLDEPVVAPVVAPVEPDPAPEVVAPTPEPIDALEEPVFDAPAPAEVALDDAPADEPTAAAEEPTTPSADDAFGRVPPPVDDAVPPPPVLEFDDVDHEAPGVLDSGPPTAPVSAVELGVDAPAPGGEDDDAFLAELRKAISDDEPLGPRDELPLGGPDALFGDDDRRGWRFGRRH